MRTAAADRTGRERMLRYCARPPFALDRLRELAAEHLLHERSKPHPVGTGPLHLLDRPAALVPPPWAHRHRYYGVLARRAAYGRFPLPPRAAGDGRLFAVAIRPES